MKKYFSIIYLFIFVVCCKSNYKDETRQLVEEWQNKNIIFPTETNVYIKNEKIVQSFSDDKRLKILSYTDSSGCLSCNMMLQAWKMFADYIHSAFKNPVEIIKVAYPRNQKDIIFELVKSDYQYPVFIDMNDSLNKLNHFPDDERFHCFLLDENNHVVLIGDPILNPNIKDFYCRIISERLGIDYHQSPEIFKVVDLGAFTKSEIKYIECIIPNNNMTEMVIDSVYTSCECTSAVIDKLVIHPNEKGLLSITYSPDDEGEFYREVYVKVKDVDKPLVYSIKGVVTQ